MVGRQIVAGVVLALSVCCARAQDLVNQPAILCGAGGWTTVGSYSNLAVLGQCGGVGLALGGGIQHYAGFLGGFGFRPALDTDADGLPDELDSDNDADGLSDTAELSGSAFGGFATADPNRADTDGDGMRDATEAAGGYDPLDSQHALAIVAVATVGGNPVLSWIGKGGGAENIVLQGTSPSASDITNEVARAAFDGGEAPWFKVTNSLTFPPTAGVAFYRVQTGE